MANLKLKNPAGGSLNFASADGASDLTVTFPATTGTAMVSGNMPAFSAVPNATQTLSAGVYTKVLFQTEEWDTNNNFASSRFTPTVAGYYQISAGFNISVATQGTVIIGFFKNGSEYRRGSQIVTTASNNLVAVASFLIYFNGSTDYVETFGYCAGTGGTITGGTNECCFNGVLVRAA